MNKKQIQIIGMPAAPVIAGQPAFIQESTGMRRTSTVIKIDKAGRSRKDGKSLSRTAQLLPGNKSDFLFVADSGPGETTEKGLIVPKFGNKPENHVAISLSFEAFSELLLMTKIHYQAWLSAIYVKSNMTESSFARDMMSPLNESELFESTKAMF